MVSYVFIIAESMLDFQIALTRLKLDGLPFMRVHPFGSDAMILDVEGNIHIMAGINNFKTAIVQIGFIHGHQDGQMLHILDVIISHGINMRRKSTCSSQLTRSIFASNQRIPLPASL